MPNQNHKLLSITTEKWHRWHIITIEGAFVIRELNKIRSVFDEVESDNMSRVALDFTKVSYLDSSAITVILNFRQRLKDRQGRLVIFGLSEDTESIITIAGLDSVIDVFSTREEFENSN